MTRAVCVPLAFIAWTCAGCSTSADSGPELDLGSGDDGDAPGVDPVPVGGGDPASPSALASPPGAPKGAGGGGAAPEVRGIVLLVVDTLRQDVLDCDEPPGLMPYTESLAALGTCVQGTRATVTWTTGGTLSLLTGANNATHGVVVASDAVPDDVPLAPDVLREHGFVSVQSSANRLATTSGIEARFDHDYNADLEPGADNASYDPAILDATERMLDELGAVLTPESRFFVHFQLFSPHYPYCPPDAEAAGDTQFAGLDYCVDPASSIASAARTDPAVLERTRELYDLECTFSDEYVRRLLETLDAAGLVEHTLFALTSDHGEELLEHGQFGHRNGLNQGQSTIPLVFAGPGVPVGTVVSGVFSQTDVLPTLLDYAGLPVPEAIEGRSLRPVIEGTEGAPYRALMSLENETSGLVMDGIAATAPDGTVWTLLVSNQRPTTLYHSETDPAEAVDLYGDPAAAEAQAFLEAQLAAPITDYHAWAASLGASGP